MKDVIPLDVAFGRKILESNVPYFCGFRIRFKFRERREKNKIKKTYQSLDKTTYRRPEESFLTPEIFVQVFLDFYLINVFPFWCFNYLSFKILTYSDQKNFR